jgi:hypothetical protein
MLRRKTIGVIVAALLIATQIGCSSASDTKDNETGASEKQTSSQVSADNNGGNIEKNKGNSSTDGENNEKALIDEFNALVQNDAEISEMIAFMDKNISSFSQENASVIINWLEKAHKEYLPELEEMINNSDAVRKNIEDELGAGLDISKADSTIDEELKKLLTDMRDEGFKFEMAEGYFFPVINYEFYKKYSSYATDDIKDYVDIMAVESNNVPAKDAGLLISWDEILTRAKSHESFIKKYENSEKVDDVKQLFKKYVYFALYGTDNTPLFSYDKKVMVPDAKTSYTSAAANSEGSEFMKMIAEYVEVLEKNGYKLTNEVENFRKNALESVK